MEEHALSEPWEDDSTYTQTSTCCCFSHSYTETAHTRAFNLAENNREHSQEAPPSYHELVLISPSVDPETVSLPSYNEVMANIDKYIK